MIISLLNFTKDALKVQNTSKITQEQIKCLRSWSVFVSTMVVVKAGIFGQLTRVKTVLQTD